jgi:N-acetylneuraminic acid mutarotase
LTKILFSQQKPVLVRKMQTTKVTIIVLLVFVLVQLALSMPLVSAADGSWVALEPIPTIRSGLGVAVVNDKVYAIGGVNDSGYLSTNEEYDPVTNTWTTKASMPTLRSDFGIAVVNNKIFCIGGIVAYDWSGNGEGILSAVNEVYDPSTDTWESRTSMPTVRQRPKAAAVNGEIYVIGGFQYTDSPPPQGIVELDTNEAYNPETDTWATKAPMPNMPSNPTSASLDSKIYVISGFQGNLTQIYDADSDSWSKGADIPTPVGLAAAASTSGEFAPKRIYVLGGYKSYDEVALNQIYNPSTDTWTAGEQMPTARHSFGIAVVNDTLYAIGGGSTNLNVRYYDNNEKYTPTNYIPEFPTLLIIPLLLITTTAIIFLRKKLA